MGRYVRVVLRELARRTDVSLTLLVRRTADAAAYRAIVDERIGIEPLRAARGRGFDRVWYPWNGMRFGSRAPALVTINDDFAFRYPAPDPVARWREQQPIRRAVREAARVVTISAWSRHAIAHRFRLDPDHIGTIPLVPDRFFCPAPPVRPTARPLVLAVGAGEARKNVQFLIEVLERAFPRRDVGVTIVGRPQRRLAERLAASPLPVTIRPDVDDMELRELYRSATAVAVPSLAEGFGLVAAEAQACGAAVIVADAGALPEAVGPAALIISPDDAGAWADGLRALVYEPHINARYRALAAARWAAASHDATSTALFEALELTIDDGT